jgi:hypothetical protein
MNYGSLIGPKSDKGSIRSWINYDPLDVEGVLLDAQAYIYTALRCREMKSSATVTLTQGDATAPLPTSFLDPIAFILSDGSRLAPLDERELIENRMLLAASTVQPAAYSVFDELIQFDALPDAGYSGTMLYYKRPALLARTNPTNFLTTRYPNLLRVACLMHGADQMQDDTEYARWKDRCDSVIAMVSVENDMGARGRDYSTSVR